jgi:hypothetical protein
LGTFYDVYTYAVYKEFLQLEFIFHIYRCAHKMGVYICQIPGAFLEWFKQKATVCKLQGQDLSDQAETCKEITGWYYKQKFLGKQQFIRLLHIYRSVLKQSSILTCAVYLRVSGTFVHRR